LVLSLEFFFGVTGPRAQRSVSVMLGDVAELELAIVELATVPSMIHSPRYS